MVPLGFGFIFLSVGFRELASNHSHEAYRDMSLLCKLAGWVLFVFWSLLYMRQTLTLS
jgi:hypothetical protein